MFSARDERRIIDAVLRVEGMLRNQEFARANPPCDAGVNIATRTQSGILTARGDDTRQLIGGVKNFDSPLEIETDEVKNAKLNFRSSSGLVLGAVHYDANNHTRDDYTLSFMGDGATALRSSGLSDSTPRGDHSALGIGWAGKFGVGRFYAGYSGLTGAGNYGPNYSGLADGAFFPVAYLRSGPSTAPEDGQSKVGLTLKRTWPFADEGWLIRKIEVVGGWVTDLQLYYAGDDDSGSSDDEGSSDGGSGSSGGGGGSGTITPVAEGGAITTSGGSATVTNVEVSSNTLLVVCLTAYDNAGTPGTPTSVRWNGLSLSLAISELLLAANISASVWFLEVTTGTTASIELEFGNALGAIGYTIHAVEIGPPTLTGASQTASTMLGGGGSTTPAAGLLTANGTCCTIGFIATAGPSADAAGTWLNNFTGTGQRCSEQMSGSENVTGDIAYNFSAGIAAINAAKSGITARDWIAIAVVFQ